MASRPDALETLVLTLELLKRIPRVGKISAGELRAQLAGLGIERDLRTIQRQLEVLSTRFDIERDDRSRPYGYSWKPNATGLSLPTLNEHESVLLSLAEQHLRNLLPAPLLRSMGGFFSRARAKLGDPGASARDKLWLRKVRVVATTQPLLPPAVAPRIFEAASNALYSDHWLDIDYRNAREQRTRARVMPLGLAQQGPRLFLVCRFEGYGNERSLALHRLVAATDTGLPFVRPADFDLERFDDEGRFGFGEGRRIRLVFRVTRGAGYHLLESPLSRDQACDDEGAWLRISATVVSSEQLRWWLRSFGDDLRVISPRGWKR